MCQKRIRDLALLLRLTLAGDGHAKALRLPMAFFDMEASISLCIQWDTYRIGEAHVSSSRMHSLLANPITPSMFAAPVWPDTIARLEALRKQGQPAFNELLANLPASFRLRRIGCASYQTLRRIYQERKGHKLSEWAPFCAFIDSLPYPELLTTPRNPRAPSVHS